MLPTNGMDFSRKSLEMARDRIDDALSIMLSECEMSFDEIYCEIRERVLDLFNYYNKPREEARKLVELFPEHSTDASTSSSDTLCPDGPWSEFFQYDSLLKSLDVMEESGTKQQEAVDLVGTNTQEEDYIECYKLSDRSIKADSYRRIVKLFEEAFNRDIRSYRFDVELLSGEGMDLLSVELIQLWSDYIVPLIIATVNEEIIANSGKIPTCDTSAYCLNLECDGFRVHEKDPERAKCNPYDYPYNHIPKFQNASDCYHIKTLFDLIHAYEKALDEHREYIQLIEKC